MTKNNKKESQNNQGGAMLVGVGLAALAAAAAGTYYLYGAKNAPKNRKKIKGWMLQAKGEVIERLESVKDVNEEMYNQIVNEVTDRYGKIKNIDLQEMKDFRNELTGHWKNIKRDIQAIVAGPKKKTASKSKGKSSKK